MKTLIFNGSPRQGNTTTAIEALKKGFENIDDIQIEEIDASNVSVSPCIACDSCQNGEGCVYTDDTNPIMEKVLDADMIVFATPVYWWGITAQLKLIIDKFYSQSETLKGLEKKVGIVAIGEAEQEDPQYTLIAEQFRCICNYLGWETVFCNTFTAGDVGDLAAMPKAIAELEGLWKRL